MEISEEIGGMRAKVFLTHTVSGQDQLEFM